MSLDGLETASARRGAGDRADGTRPGHASGHAIDHSPVVSLVDSMTLAEKVGQMTQVERGSISPEEVARWGIGSVLSGGGSNPGDGSPASWRAAVESFVDASRRSRLGIPIVYGTDAVHGHNNVRGATIFPHNIGMGAALDEDLMRRAARAASLETSATGARWSFSPCLAVPQDIRWGRTYEGFSQDPGVVCALGRAAVEGWHGADLAREGVLACAKHYVGEGAMQWGTAGSSRHPWIDWWDGWNPEWQIDQGDIRIDEGELRQVHLAPFAAAIDAGALTVMACYGSWLGKPLHSHRYLLTDLLKGELAFAGFVVSDWMAIDQLDPDYPTAVAEAICAGVDMVMVPFDYRRFISTVLELAEADRIPVDRIDDAVRRILYVKSELGLLAPPENPSVPLDVVGCQEHRELARACVRASAVVLSDHEALPIRRATTILAAGEALDDIGIACGGWTISWEGSPGRTTDGRTILDGLQRIAGPGRVIYEPTGTAAARAPFGVVSVHELPYVEGGGDRADLSVPENQLAVVRRMRTQVDRLIVLVISGRPLLMDPIIELADAIVACWLPGSEADGIAELLLGQAPFTGRLPLAWPHGESDIAVGSATGAPVHGWPVGHSKAPEHA